MLLAKQQNTINSGMHDFERDASVQVRDAGHVQADLEKQRVAASSLAQEEIMRTKQLEEHMLNSHPILRRNREELKQLKERLLRLRNDLQAKKFEESQFVREYEIKLKNSKDLEIKLNHSIDNLTRAEADSQMRLSEMEMELNGLNHSLECAKQRKSVLQQRIESLIAHENQQEQAYSKAQGEIMEIEGKLSEFQREELFLRGNLEQFKAAAEKQGNDKNQLCSQREAVETELRNAASLEARVQNELNEKKRLLVPIQDTLNRLESNQRLLHDEISEIITSSNVQLKHLSNEKEMLSSKRAMIFTLEKERAELLKRLEQIDGVLLPELNSTIPDIETNVKRLQDLTHDLQSQIRAKQEFLNNEVVEQTNRQASEVFHLEQIILGLEEEHNSIRRNQSQLNAMLADINMKISSVIPTDYPGQASDEKRLALVQAEITTLIRQRSQLPFKKPSDSATMKKHLDRVSHEIQEISQRINQLNVDIGYKRTAALAAYNKEALERDLQSTQQNIKHYTKALSEQFGTAMQAKQQLEIQRTEDRIAMLVDEINRIKRNIQSDPIEYLLSVNNPKSKELEEQIKREAVAVMKAEALAALSIKQKGISKEAEDVARVHFHPIHNNNNKTEHEIILDSEAKKNIIAEHIAERFPCTINNQQQQQLENRVASKIIQLCKEEHIKGKSINK